MHLRRLLVISMLAAGPAAAQTAFINGAVVSAAFSSPLAGITVVAYGANGLPAATTSTDPAGHYTLAVSFGTYRLLAYDLNGTYATSFYSNATSFETSAQLNLTASLYGVDFEMVRGFQVSGRVIASAGTPLLGMVVAAYNTDGSRRGFANTSGSGDFALVLPPGTYRFAAYDKSLNYATSFYQGQSSFEAATPVSVSSAVSGIDFSLPLAARVTGSALDRGTGAPLASLSVDARKPDGALVYSTTTDTNGRFTMALAPGDYKFLAFDEAKYYAVSYFSDASSFASAPSFHLAAGLALAGVNFLMSPVPPPSSRTTIFVPGAANVSGLGGTYFQTDVWVTNPSASAIVFVVTYLPGGQDNSGRQGVSLSLGPHSQVAIANILDNLFRTTGAGALKLDSDASFLATSRTYNSAASAGTFGVGIAGRPLASSVSRGIILGLSSNVSYRSNVAVMNPQPVPVTVTFQLYRADGTALGQGTQRLAPFDWFQASTIFGFLGVVSTEDNAYVTVSSPDGSFFSYGSVVDQRSGDGTVIEAVGY
jgi:5-hydroxyisourate hydrolase-like protein (transthyretin family)